LEVAAGHAVTVVGIRKASVQNRDEQLILHDPAKQPFVERSTSFCFKACWTHRKYRPALVMIMPTEKGVSRSLYSCLKTLRNTRLSLFELLLRGNSRLYPFVKFDYQFSLEYCKDINTFLWPIPLGSDDREGLQEQFGFKKNRYWCLAGYQDGHLQAAWFFSTDGRDDEEWELQLFRNNQGKFVICRSEGDGHYLSLPNSLASSLRRLQIGQTNAG
jgi:hypothetical protein